MYYPSNHPMPGIWVFGVQLINSCAFHCEVSTMTARERGGSTRETRKPICYLLPFSHSTPIYVWNKYINCHKATYWWTETSRARFEQEAGRSGAWRKQEGGSRVYSVCYRSVLGSPWVANVMWKEGLEEKGPGHGNRSNSRHSHVLWAKLRCIVEVRLCNFLLKRPAHLPVMIPFFLFYFCPFL